RILGARQGQRIPFSPKTQEKVRSAAGMLGYRPSKLARGLTQSKTGIVGLVIPSVKDSFFPSLTIVIETQLAEKGYNVILANTNADSKIEQAKIDDLLSWRVDGLVVAPSQETGDAGLYWSLWQQKVPFVLIDRTFDQTPFYSVTTDDYTGGTLATQHLLSLGRTRIACAGGTLTVSTNRNRYTAYVDSLIHHGLVPDPRLWFQVVSTEESGKMVIHQLMEMDPRPDALFCLSDPVAIGALEECLRLGIRIPQDLALVGYADLPYSNLLKIPLTSVHQPRELLGHTAAQMLIDQMEDHTPETVQLKLPVELMIRESTVPKS
ncbi:MAG TPA: LacI family DNA-binding transcriptional regulator, partial [Armatimonadota bacterium]|nr:LacI family DNA-binding transcriptional regulator [Armatimonadota bacterium]